MDSDLGRWVLGFLLRAQKTTTMKDRDRDRMRVRDTLMKRIGRAIPLSKPKPHFHFHFQKAALLSMLREDYSTVSINEDMLLKLEVFEELHLRSGYPLSPAFPAAYCAIAVECTLKYLELEPSPSNNPAYLSAVDRIWRGPRLRKIIESGSVLFSEELKRWSSDIEASFQDPEVRERLWTMNCRRYAIQRLKLLLDEAQNDLGPSFLGFVASMTTAPDTSTAHLQTVKLKDLEPPVENQIVDKPIENQCIDAPVENQSIDVPAENQCIDAPVENQSIDVPVEKQSIDVPVENQCIDAPVENQSSEAPIENEGADIDLREQPVCQTTASYHPSLMERNNTARTDEWDKSTDGSGEEIPNNACRVQLPSPKRRKMSPLKWNEPPKIVRRRKAKKWSALEEETLRDAVNKIGEGNWKSILDSHKDVFGDRTQVDLKDKWRNLRRYGAK